MPTLPNTGMNSPNNGDNLGTWDVPLRQNWSILDALFAGLPSTSVGGTGHVHNGTPGQGPQLDHTYLTSIGAKTHPMLEADLTTVSNRLTFVETTYCADKLCGAGSGGGGLGDANQPPVHYTDNFTTARGTRLGSNDWLVSSDSTVDRLETTGRSAIMFIDPLLVGTPVVERYAAVVHAQIPHSMAQRCTFAITRFTADRMQNDDTFMLVSALVSTNTLGASTPFIHYCGIKLVLIVSNSGGVFTVTRQAVVEQTDGLFQVVAQDAITGLTYQYAEAYIRGIHEFSISKDGGLWYYASRMPVWIMPPGTVSQYYGPLQATLLGLGEPPYGAVGFGFSWNIKPSSVIDVEMSWFTMDSDDNVEDSYSTPDFPPNWPRPYDPVPQDLCCGGAGPGIGDDFDVYNDGTRIEKVIAKVGDTAFRISSGEVIPCSLMSVGTIDTTPGPEGSSGSVDIPMSSAPPADTLIVSSPDAGITITDVAVNDAGTIVTVGYSLTEHSSGDSFQLDLVSSYDPGNAVSVPDAILATNAVPTILSIDWTDVEGNTLSGPTESILQYADIYTENSDYPVAGPPYPADPGALLVLGGTGYSLIRRWFVSDNHFRILLDSDDCVGGEVGTPGSGTSFTITINNRDSAGTTETLKFIPRKPTVHWVTGSSPPWPAPGTYQINVYGYNFRDTSFTTPTTFDMKAPHAVVSVVSYVSTEQVTLSVNIADLGGGSTGNVELRASHGVYVEPYKVVQYNQDLSGHTVVGVSATPTNPQVEGSVTDLVIAGTNFPEALYRVQPFYNSGSPTIVEMNRILGLSIPTTTTAFLKMFVDYGQAGVDILVEMDKAGLATKSGTAAVTVVQPTPSSDDTWSSGTYPGATGTLTINDPSGSNSYLPGIAIFAASSGTIIPLGVTQWIDANNLSATYTLPSTLTPGNAINVTLTNPSSAAHTWTSKNVADFPVNILRVVWEDQLPMEGRHNVIGKIYCTNLNASATATIASGATLNSYMVVGQIMVIDVTFGTMTGGNTFVVQINNPTPVPSSASASITVVTEPDPIVGVYITPPTPGAARTIRLVGNNLYPPDVYSTGIVPALTLTTNLVWNTARQTKGEWQGTVDIVGTPGQALNLSMTRPSGRSFSKTGVFTILPLDLIPSGISASPNTLQSARLVTVEISGTNLGSVQSIDLECEQPTRQPIGSSARVPCTITGATASLIRMQCTVPTGNVSLTYKAIFYNRFLDPLKTESSLFAVVKSSTGPMILNKPTLWSIINPTAGASQTITVSLDPATPITDKNTEIVGTNIAISSITDISPGGAPGTVFDVVFTNGSSGQEAELAFFNKQVVPEEKDVLRWLIS